MNFSVQVASYGAAGGAAALRETEGTLMCCPDMNCSLKT